MLRDKGQQVLCELKSRRKLRHHVVHEIQKLQKHGAELIVLPHLAPNELGNRLDGGGPDLLHACCSGALGVLVAAAHAPGPELW